MNVLIPKVKLNYEGFQTPIRGGEVDAAMEGGYGVVGLDSSNVADEGLDTWDIATTYAVDDQVAWSFRKWTAKTATSGFEPSIDTADGVTNWTFDGWLNKYSMFNGILGEDNVTTNPTIDVSMSASSVDALALLGVQCTNVTITITDPSEGEVYSYTDNINPELPDANFYSWYYEYQTAEFTGVVKTDLVLTDLIGSQYPNATLRIVLDLEDGGLSYTDDVILEYLAFGPTYSLGTANFGTSHGFTDYSTIEENTYGEITTVKRKRNKKATYQIIEKTDRLGDIQRFLSANTTNPMVFIGNGAYSGTITYAIASDFEPSLQNANTTSYSIKTKGL